MEMIQQPLSVIITTFNEQHNIEGILDSVVGFADEVMVVDSFSTDQTLAIIYEQYPSVKIHQRQYLCPAEQKNWAIPQAKNEWVLIMDADERLTPGLKAEIQAILGLDAAAACDCYWIGFTHFFMGRRVHYSGWQNDKTIRLIRRDKCRYNKNRVHEEIVTTNLRVGKLENRFLHYTFKDFTHFMDKQIRYARWSAEDKFDATPKVTAYHLLVKPFARFFKHFVLKFGFLDGRVGFLISVIASYCVFLRYVFIMEKRRKNSQNSQRVVRVQPEKRVTNVAEKEVS